VYHPAVSCVLEFDHHNSSHKGLLIGSAFGSLSVHVCLTKVYIECGFYAGDRVAIVVEAIKVCQRLKSLNPCLISSNLCNALLMLLWSFKYPSSGKIPACNENWPAGINCERVEAQ
jgi:hypothetical protein